MDIVLGSFRYCVNEVGRKQAAAQVFPLITPLLWTREIRGQHYVREYGLHLRPQRVQSELHQRAYDGLVVRLTALPGGD